MNSESGMGEDDLFGGGASVAPSRDMPPLLPWQSQPWSILTADLSRLAHALLLAGRAGLGKGAFARRLAQLLLCLSPRERHEPCGTCKSCSLFVAGSHPDFKLLSPPETGRAITVDQIRELNSFLSLRPHTAARKIVIITPADAMNVNAANSLLKQLEEPPLGSILLLVTSAPERLPATIRSRCAKVPFVPPPKEEAIAWLAQVGVPGPQQEMLLGLAGGAPLQALALAEGDIVAMRETLLADLEALSGSRGEVVTCAARWKEYGAARALEWLQIALGDMIKLILGGAENSRLANIDLSRRLQACGKRLQLNELFPFLDQVSGARALLGGPLDEQLMIESLLITWSRLAR